MARHADYPRTPGDCRPGGPAVELGAAPRPLRFLSLREVRQRTTLSRPTIYRRMAAGTFPRQVTLGGRSVAWVEAEVEAWMRDCIAPAEGHRRCA